MAPRYRELLLPAVLSLAACIVLVALGNWQLRRLVWKEDLIAKAAERPLEAAAALPPVSAWQGFDIAGNEFRPFQLTGRFLHDAEALVFTSLSDAKGPFDGPGYWVVTPFALESGGTVFVNRGFAPQVRYRPENRGEARPGNQVTVTGLLRPNDTPNLFTPDDRPAENVFFARNVQNLAAAKQTPAPVAPLPIGVSANAGALMTSVKAAAIHTFFDMADLLKRTVDAKRAAPLRVRGKPCAVIDSRDRSAG